MKRAIVCLVITALGAVAQTSIPQSYKEIRYPALNPIKIPPVDRYVLPNGATVFLVEDHEIPVVRAQALIRAGERYDPPAKAGLTALTTQVMRTGGTKSRSGDDIDKELDKLAASVETGSSDNSASGTMFVLKEDAEKGLSILADVLRDPIFPQDKIELAKSDMRDGISRRNDSADSIHYREMQKLLFGKTSPYALETEYATVDAITREDLVAYHQRYFQPENVYLAVWGDFKAAEMKQLLARTFGAWPKGGKPKPSVPGVDAAAQGKGLYLVTKDDINQSTIDIGRLGVRLDDPDYSALRAMTQILGGGFGSRLFKKIRTAEGLAYAAYAGNSAQYDHPGFWFASVGTKSQSTVKALTLMRQEIARMRDEEVTDEELRQAKDSLLKGEAFDYDSTGKIVGRLLTYEYFGYPSNFLQQSRNALERVTKADVQRVAKKYLGEDSFMTLVLGNPKEFDKALTTLGKVTDIDITIPAPKGQETPSATPQATTEGKGLLETARAAHGGAAIAKVKDYVAKIDMTITTPQGEFAMKGESTVSEAGKNVMKMTTPMGEIVQGFNGQTLWMKTPQGTQEMPGNSAQAKSAAMRETIALLRDFDKPGFTTQSLGSTKLDGKDVQAVLVKNEAQHFEVKVYLDPATGLLAGKTYTGQLPMAGRGEITEVSSDIREVDGVKIAFRSVILNNGKKSAEQKITELKINTGVADSAFNKPQ